MPSADEQAIRELVNKWQQATAIGDLNSLLSMVSEDVVFLAPGQSPLHGKDEFAAAFRTAWQHLRIQAQSQIEEIRIVADMAYCWAYFNVTLTSLKGEAPKKRKGHTLTILRKTMNGTWVITRDANMLANDPA